MDNSIKLKDDVARQYDVAPGAVKEFLDTQLGMIDLNKITLDKAKKLAALRPGILIEKSPSKKAPEESK